MENQDSTTKSALNADIAITEEAKPLTSQNTPCISSKVPTFLDSVNITCALSTTDQNVRSVHYTPRNQQLFSSKGFRVQPNGFIRTRTIVTNGASIERDKVGQPDKLAKDADNQLTDQEKASLLARCNGMEPWEDQVDHYIKRYTELFTEIHSNTGDLLIGQPILTAELYREIPHIRVEGKFQEHIGKKVESSFGGARRIHDRTPKAHRDGDGTYWIIPIKLKGGRKLRTYLKIYEKGDYVRLEVRIENFRCDPHGLPAASPAALNLLRMSLFSAFNRLAVEATEILDRVFSALSSDHYPFNVALFRKALKCMGRRNVSANLRYTVLLEALAEHNCYTPNRIPPDLVLSDRTLKDLCCDQKGLLEKVAVRKGETGDRVFYRLRLDWEERAKWLISNSQMSN